MGCLGGILAAICFALAYFFLKVYSKIFAYTPPSTPIIIGIIFLICGIVFVIAAFVPSKRLTWRGS